MRPLLLLLAALLVEGIAGCGGGSHPKHPAAHRAAPSAPGPFRWLVRTDGPPPSVAAENRMHGTTEWQLPGARSREGGQRSGSVSGYVSQQAVRPGQIERIYVAAPGARRVRIRIFRMGWYGGTGGREVLSSNTLKVVAQPPCHHVSQTGLTECDWHPTLTFRVPTALPSGVYIAKLSAGSGQSDCLFVVEGGTRTPLIAQLPTSTYEAYNAWGGDSLYPGGADPVGVSRTTQGVEVSYDRPYDSMTGAGQFFARDVAMVRFLERYGYPVSYTTSESVDEDPGQLLGRRAVIEFGHDEYWSQGQERAFARARASGVNLLFFGSDLLAWRARYGRATRASSAFRTSNHVMIEYKQYASPESASRFPDGGASLTGSEYIGCITPRLPQRGPPTYRYYEWAPAPGLQPSWLFAHTGITSATRIPGIVGYELDQRTSEAPRGAGVLGDGTAPCMGGAEPGEPRSPSVGVADTTLYRAPSGAIVFASGTLGWELGLEPVPGASPDAPIRPDRRVVAMTRNLLDHVLGR